MGQFGSNQKTKTGGILQGHGLTQNVSNREMQQVGNSNRYWNMATTSGRKPFVRKISCYL
jgi:hypothetical protein